VGNFGERWDRWVAGANERPADHAERDELGLRAWARGLRGLGGLWLILACVPLFYTAIGASEANVAAIAADMFMLGIVGSVIWYANRRTYATAREIRAARLTTDDANADGPGS
jgi:hypothetical protein